MEVSKRKTRSKSVGCVPTNQEPLREIVTHIEKKYSAINADIRKMGDSKDLSLEDVKTQIQFFLTSWTREELLTLVNVKIDEEILDKYNVLNTKRENKKCHEIIKSLRRDNRELKGVISLLQNSFAELHSEEDYICPRTKINLASNPQTHLNNGYEINNTPQRFPKMMELDQFELFEPTGFLGDEKLPNRSNLFIFECLIKQLEGCVAKRKQAYSSIKLERHLILECFKRFPQISLNHKNNACHNWSTRKVTINRPFKTDIQKKKAGNKIKRKYLNKPQENSQNSGHIHPPEDDTPARLPSRELETDKTIALNIYENIHMNVEPQSKTPLTDNVPRSNEDLVNADSRNNQSQQITDAQKKYLLPKIKKFVLKKPPRNTVGINNVPVPLECFIKEEPQDIPSQRMPTIESFPNISYYKKIQEIVQPKSKTCANKNIVLSSSVTGLENIDLAKQSSILNSLLRNNSDASLRALNKHCLINKINYQSVDDNSNCTQNSDSSTSQTPADNIDMSIKSERPSLTSDAHNLAPNVSNISPMSTDVAKGCKQITLSTKPSCYEETDTSPVVNEVNLDTAFRNTERTGDLNNASGKNTSWTPVRIFRKKKIRVLNTTNNVIIARNEINRMQNVTHLPSSKVNIKAVNIDHPYSSKSVKVRLHTIPIEVDLASNHKDAIYCQPTIDYRQTLNHLDRFVQSNATISPLLGLAQMDPFDKKHKSDDDTLGHGINGVPIKKIKLSFKPLQISETRGSVNVADESVNLKIKMPINCYSRTSSPNRTGANKQQLVTDKPISVVEIDEPRVDMIVLQVKTERDTDEPKVNTIGLQVKTKDNTASPESQVEVYMPRIQSVTSLSQNQATAVVSHTYVETKAPQTNSENESENAVPPIEAETYVPQWYVNMPQKLVEMGKIQTQTEINVSQTQTEISGSQTQVKTDTRLETVTPQTQTVPNMSQSEAEANMLQIQVHTDVLQTVREKWRQLVQKPK